MYPSLNKYCITLMTDKKQNIKEISALAKCLHVVCDTVEFLMSLQSLVLVMVST